MIDSFEIKLTKCLPQTNISIVIHAYKELKTTPQEFLSLWRKNPISDVNIQNAHIGKMLFPEISLDSHLKSFL